MVIQFDPGPAEPGRVAPEELQRRLTRCGLSPDRDGTTGPDAVRLTLCGRGWESQNLAALVASARAHPGRTVSAGSAASAFAPGLSAGAKLPTAPVAIQVLPPSTIFLDRDGTILQPVPYLNDAAQVALLPGAAAGLRRLADAGRRLVVLTNQSGIGRGVIAPEELERVHARMESLLQARGVRLDGIFTCPHAPDAGCGCRKPAIGMARAAAERFGLDLTRSIVVGDAVVDIGLARQLQVPAVLVLSGDGMLTLRSGTQPPDLAITDLEELAEICLHPAGVGLEPAPSSGHP